MNEHSNNIFLSDGKLGDSLKHGSLFSGIGGFDLAAEWMGWENVLHCEWNEFGRKVLKHYWPKSKSYEDITKTDFSIHRGRIDILTGGFPCQPYSSAGKRLGKEDDRHLWPEMLRAIREIKPKYIVAENVSGLLSWNGGLVFNEVQADLEAEGYEVQPVLLPASGVNAPHKRERVWFVAFNTKCDAGRPSENLEGKNKKRFIVDEQKGIFQKKDNKCDGQFNISRNFTDTHSAMRKGREKRNEAQEGSESIKKQFRGHNKLFRKNFEEFPSKPPFCGRDDGISRELDGITFPKWRNESIKAYGNAIVPQVALQIFKAIIQTKN